MSRDPTIEAIEAQVDAENERRADEYWEVEDPEPFDECTGPLPKPLPQPPAVFDPAMYDSGETFGEYTNRDGIGYDD